ncbi:hypothetical protein Murmansk-167 [Murmansk poxvirus]|uniref:Uncharacterized protein n=1 Tax=Murmansk poxvirus TaxID=2025359 RepID=A0A223FN17_9POXV|nr:hypothetical protein CKM52_gp167 [Murmansk poxvirus]AST09362.1 hypothetical protein Murmansk-167 [Murmansk poxvirus]
MEDIDEGFVSEEYNTDIPEMSDIITRSTKHIVRTFRHVDNKELNNNIVNFIMGESNLNNPFVTYLDIAYIISYSKFLDSELLNSYNRKEIIDYIVNLYGNFYTNDAFNIVYTIIILKYIMSLKDFKSIYRDAITRNLMNIDIRNVICNELEMITDIIRK